MVRIQAIRAANQAFAERAETGLVAVFVGGTSGISEYTMKKFAKYTKEPSIYFVGRSETAAARIQDELKILNPASKTTFIKADLSTLAAVDTVTAQLKKLEKKINVLQISAGYLTMKGRDETEDGLDRKMVLNYYSRVRFMLNLLPLLKTAAAEDVNSAVGARVLSVLAPGTEGAINENDLELKNTFSLKAAADHTTSFNSFAMEKLAAENPEIGWLHVYPSIVLTGVIRELPAYARFGAKIFTPFAVTEDDCGDGIAQLICGEQWKKGMALVGWDGENRDTRTQQSAGGFGRWIQMTSKPWWSEERRELSWKHTQEVMARVPLREDA